MASDNSSETYWDEVTRIGTAAFLKEVVRLKKAVVDNELAEHVDAEQTAGGILMNAAFDLDPHLKSQNKP
ncbi:unnamed protein product [Sphagnum jensenii]|uniref:Uncharacterized protein n=1 Tax=Sphagnum jensenii TaxID=128206 RepID=A0ABP0V9X4_9BRYO